VVECKPCQEHNKCHGSHGVDKVSPSLVCRIMRAQKPPSDQTRN
jgi:hypothetical protein